MDETPDAFAYRCLPLSIANSHGWEICCSTDFEAEWTGGSRPDDVVVYAEDTTNIDINGHFGSGILTFHSKFIMRSQPGYSLWVTGPSNSFKDGIQPLSAAVETDWIPFSFSMNWKITRPNFRIRFSKGEPYCFFFPIRTGEVEQFMPKMKHIDRVPELKEQFGIAGRKRNFMRHIITMKERGYIKSPIKDGKLRPIMYQGWYSKGQFPNGSPWPEHRKKIRVRPFEVEKIEKKAPVNDNT